MLGTGSADRNRREVIAPPDSSVRESKTPPQRLGWTGGMHGIDKQSNLEISHPLERWRFPQRVRIALGDILTGLKHSQILVHMKPAAQGTLHRVNVVYVVRPSRLSSEALGLPVDIRDSGPISPHWRSPH